MGERAKTAVPGGLETCLHSFQIRLDFLCFMKFESGRGGKTFLFMVLKTRTYRLYSF